MKFKILLIACFVLAACSKKDTPPIEPGNSLPTGVYRVVNLVADTTATSAGNAVSMYYSLEENKVIPESQRQTGRWDIVFYGIYNSSVYPNNGAAVGSPAYGGPGNARVYVVVDRKFDAQYYDTLNFKPKTLPIPRSLFNTAFDAVKTVPDESKLGTRDIGLDHFQGEADGWGYYDFYGALFPGNAKKSHIVYTMPRVIIVKTHKGHYAKVMIENIYKDNPEDPTRDNKPGFVTFKYAIQMDGSKNLDIK
ncbi:hypothetical protein GFS24_27790 [Chitinophaga sp. SYP-B3965]|uniref:HmuY family protein n=1 Tax=Chitinophaga sp. SYP-B3965 TaxID=2663120 RepID=UPI0012997349|nr:HmuY family protein [Chitinophaga sp. SYP-B3965]MRG48945.1 hypothetical protein [Chitinophaga sp. SYP-B3965]